MNKKIVAVTLEGDQIDTFNAMMRSSGFGNRDQSNFLRSLMGFPLVKRRGRVKKVESV